MKKGFILAYIITLLSFFAVLFTGHPITVSAQTETEGETPTPLSASNNYSSVYQQWLLEGLRDDHNETVVVSPFDFLLNSTGTLTHLNEEYATFLNENQLSNGVETDVYQWDEEQSLYFVEMEVEVSQTALYTIKLDYYSQTTSIRDIEMSLLINGETPYYEASQITLSTFWQTNQEVMADRYGNDIMPTSEQHRKWTHTYLHDAPRIQENPLVFKLEAGINMVRIEVNNGLFLLGQVYFGPQVSYQSYETYLEENQFIGLAHDAFVRQEAEEPTLKNTLSIRYGTNRSPNVRPFALIENRLNIIDGSTYNDAGDTLYYDLEVPFSGFYYITLKVLQTKTNTRVFRTVTINGEVPFTEALTVPFDYGTRWRNQTLTDVEGERLAFYLEEGINRIGLTVNSSPMRQIYENIRFVMSGINELALDVKKLTGSNIDRNVEWEIADYMPNLQSDLVGYGDLIKSSYEQWLLLNKTSRTSEISSGLKISYEWLYDLSENPNQVPRRLARLSGGANSVLQKLGIILPLVIESPLTIDVLYVHGQEVNLPAANANFFRSAWISIRRFFASFFSDQYRASRDPEELEIWVNRSRQYVNLMQQMVDSEFTQETGVKVKISIMPNEDKLILAASSGTEPDIAMGVAGWRPYDFAIRDAILDLRQFDDFNEVASRFHTGSLLQLVYQDGIYGLPETQNFYVLFYRRDIIENLNLIIPDTWDEVISILPELQRYGLNFYSQLATTSSFKGFATTMPYIYQFGGKIFEDDALSAAFDDPKTIEAITFMTELFTIYSLPLEVGSFYNEFRYGSIPIGIGDFGMYNQLLNAAPEIAGLWDIAPMPGILREDGIVDRSYDGASTSAMVFKNTDKADESWEFLKWWTSDDVQLRYSENLITSMGAEYMWNTSNVNAFAQMSWDSSHINVFLEQWEWIYDTVKTPASYMLEREISNIWNTVVYDGENVRTAIEDSMVIVNKEITRKMIEFNFIRPNGDLVTPYILPTKELVEGWLANDA